MEKTSDRRRIRPVSRHRLHRLAGGFFRGRGVILTFHRIRPAQAAISRPTRLLEITPAFLDGALTRLRESGLRDRLARRGRGAANRRPGEGAPFAVLTFDDGFRDVARSWPAGAGAP